MVKLTMGMHETICSTSTLKRRQQHHVIFHSATNQISDASFPNLYSLLSRNKHTSHPSLFLLTRSLLKTAKTYTLGLGLYA